MLYTISINSAQLNFAIPILECIVAVTIVLFKQYISVMEIKHNLVQGAKCIHSLDWTIRLKFLHMSWLSLTG